MDHELTPPLVSVVIPTHSRRAILSRTLDTALAQRDVDLEVVVVDDGSDDDTAAFLAGHPDPRVRSIGHEFSRGAAAARNTGIDAATGEWIAFLDDDDLWAPDKLSTQIEEAGRTGADVVYVAGLRVDGDLRPRDALGVYGNDVLLEEMLDCNRIAGSASSIMATRALIDRVGRFDERLAHISDWDMWLRLVEAGTVAACDEPLMAYVVHGGSKSTKGGRSHVRDLEIMAANHDALARRMGRPVGGTDYWEWMAWGARIGGRRREAAAIYLNAARRFRRPSHLARAAAAFVGPPLMDFGSALADRVDRPPSSPGWLDSLRDSLAGGVG